MLIDHDHGLPGIDGRHNVVGTISSEGSSSYTILFVTKVEKETKKKRKTTMDITITVIK